MTQNRIAIAVALQRYVGETPVAERQRELGMALAKARGAELHVLTVEAPVALMPDVETTAEKLARYIAPITEGDVAMVHALRTGRPSEAIVAYAEEAGIDTLIVGSHSKRSVLDVGLGSTASALSRAAHCAVVLVRPTAEEQARTQDIMIPGMPMVFPYA